MQQPLSNEYSGHFHSEGDQWLGTTINTDIYNHYGVVINAKVAPRTDFTGHYAHNALSPVATYTKRPNLYQQIETQLHDRIAVVNTRTQVQVVHGIGGAGKTQLVLNYVQECRQDYTAVFWIEAGSKESVERDYLQIYQLLYNVHFVAGQPSIKLADAVSAIKSWFCQHQKRWLFVIDSADNISDSEHPSYVDLGFFLPDDPSVHVIITTRDGNAKKMSTLLPVEVGNMEQAEATELFKKHAEMTNPTMDEDDEVLRIVQELGYLALAIILAGSYVSTTPRLRSDVSQYLPEYRKRRKDLLSQKPDWLVNQYGESVLSTWETTFHALQNRCPEACRLLAVLAFLHGDDIFMMSSALNADDDISASWTQFICKYGADQYSLERFFAELQNLSFVNYRGSQKSYTMHKLIQTWACDRLAADEQRYYGTAAAALIGEVIDNTQAADPFAKSRLVPHLITSFDRFRISFEFLAPEDCGILDYLEIAASFLYSCGRWNDVASFRKFLLAKSVIIYGKAHLHTILAMNNLAVALDDIGELQEALSIKYKVLRIRKQVLGEEHPDTIGAMSNLAVTLSKTGELQEALSIQRKTVEISNRVLGEEHPDTITMIGILAIILSQVGELQDALSVHREILKIRKRVLGEEHLDTISAISNLAVMLHNVGELKEALPMTRKVLETRKRVLGKEHPDTISTMNNLAAILDHVGELQEALSMKREVLETRKRVLGKEHPSTIVAMGSLANTLVYVGELRAALSIQYEVLKIMKRGIGEEHPNTILTIYNLGITLWKSGQHQYALSMLQEVEEKRSRILGVGHPDTISTKESIQILLEHINSMPEKATILSSSNQVIFRAAFQECRKTSG